MRRLKHVSHEACITESMHGVKHSSHEVCIAACCMHAYVRKKKTMKAKDKRYSSSIAGDFVPKFGNGKLPVIIINCVSSAIGRSAKSER